MLRHPTTYRTVAMGPRVLCRMQALAEDVERCLMLAGRLMADRMLVS